MWRGGGKEAKGWWVGGWMVANIEEYRQAFYAAEGVSARGTYEEEVCGGGDCVDE